MNYQNSNISSNNFEQCIKCTICTVYCPVTAVNPEYPGPKQAGPDGERYRLKKPLFYDEALKYCMNCKRCEVACPSNVKIGDIIQLARLKYSKRRPGLREQILANTDFMGSVATTFAPVVNATVKQKPVKKIMDAVLKIDSHRTFPQYAKQKFTTWFKRNAQKYQASFPNQVTYFHGCYANYNYPQLGKDLVKILNAVGYGVNLMEKERCCGVAKISNNLFDQAKRDAAVNLSEIRRSVAENREVIATSTTCTFTMRDEYHHILGLENGDVREQINLASRFLNRLVEEGKIKFAFKDDFKVRAAYHTPCHMEKLGWSIYSISLMRMIPGLELRILDSNCCGIAGTYGFKQENYKYSQAIGAPLFKQIADLGVEIVACDCETCKWQIEMSTGVKVENPISILAQALDVKRTMKLNNIK